MAKHSISEAAKLAGVSRSHLYKKYIRPGAISVEKDSEGNPQIDTAEVMRVFGGIHGDTADDVSKIHKDTSENSIKNTALHVEIQLLREQLTAAGEREKWLQGKVDQLTGQLDNTTRLLEHRTTQEQPQKKKRFWFF